LIDLLIKIIICISVVFLAFKFKVLDYGGAIFAVIVGGLILFSKGISWFVILLLFLILGATVTRYKKTFKKGRLHDRASRRAMNVIANGLIPAILAPLSLKYDFSIPFVASIAVALSDTFASELGVLSNNAYLITNLKKVEPGTNGAISLLGESMGLLGSIIISICGGIFLGLTVFEMLLCIAFGYFGCHIDSLLGATFQGKYKGIVNEEDTILTNSDVNLISIMLTALLAFIVVQVI
jgi:uncharacterized protein (TIGR00297 family)